MAFFFFFNFFEHTAVTHQQQTESLLANCPPAKIAYGEKTKNKNKNETKKQQQLTGSLSL